MNDQKMKLPTSFWVISVIGLIWNLMGVMNFFGQTFMSDEAMAALPQEQQTLFQSVPTWMTAVFAIAVLTGTLGCIALLLRKGWAQPLFLISLVAVLVQVSYSLFVVNIGSVLGTMSVVVMLLVLFFAIFFYYYAKQSQNKGWIS